jgi:hypothetical protein
MNLAAALRQADLLQRRARVYENMGKKRLREYTDEELHAIVGRTSTEAKFEQRNTKPAVDQEMQRNDGST